MFVGISRISYRREVVSRQGFGFVSRFGFLVSIVFIFFIGILSCWSFCREFVVVDFFVKGFEVYWDSLKEK